MTSVSCQWPDCIKLDANPLTFVPNLVAGPDEAKAAPRACRTRLALFSLTVRDTRIKELCRHHGQPLRPHQVDWAVRRTSAASAGRAGDQAGGVSKQHDTLTMAPRRWKRHVHLQFWYEREATTTINAPLQGSVCLSLFKAELNQNVQRSFPCAGPAPEDPYLPHGPRRQGPLGKLQTFGPGRRPIGNDGNAQAAIH